MIQCIYYLIGIWNSWKSHSSKAFNLIFWQTKLHIVMYLIYSNRNEEKHYWRSMDLSLSSWIGYVIVWLILGPLFFSRFINNIPSILQYGEFKMVVNELQIYIVENIWALAKWPKYETIISKSLNGPHKKNLSSPLKFYLI